jgi:hypothetical protein
MIILHFGAVDEDLLAIGSNLARLPDGEFMLIIMQTNRQDLIDQFTF